MKINEQLLLEFRLEMEEAITEREGMIAENLQRVYIGQSMAYVEDSFLLLQNKIQSIRERLISIGEK